MATSIIRLVMLSCLLCLVVSLPANLNRTQNQVIQEEPNKETFIPIPPNNDKMNKLSDINRDQPTTIVKNKNSTIKSQRNKTTENIPAKKSYLPKISNIPKIPYTPKISNIPKVPYTPKISNIPKIFKQEDKYNTQDEYHNIPYQQEILNRIYNNIPLNQLRKREYTYNNNNNNNNIKTSDLHPTIRMSDEFHQKYLKNKLSNPLWSLEPIQKDDQYNNINNNYNNINNNYNDNNNNYNDNNNNYNDNNNNYNDNNKQFQDNEYDYPLSDISSLAELLGKHNGIREFEKRNYNLANIHNGYLDMKNKYQGDNSPVVQDGDYRSNEEINYQDVEEDDVMDSSDLAILMNEERSGVSYLDKYIQNAIENGLLDSKLADDYRLNVINEYLNILLDEEIDNNQHHNHHHHYQEKKKKQKDVVGDDNDQRNHQLEIPELRFQRRLHIAEFEPDFDSKTISSMKGISPKSIKYDRQKELEEHALMLRQINLENDLENTAKNTLY